MPFISLPSKLILPRESGCRPVTARSGDDVPTPFRPRTQVILALSALIEMPRRPRNAGWRARLTHCQVLYIDK